MRKPAPILGIWLALLSGCAATEPVRPPPRRHVAPKRVGPDYPRLVREARAASLQNRFPTALRLLSCCLRAPDRDRSALRRTCLHLGQKVVDRAYAYYVRRNRWLHDLESFGDYPTGCDRYGNDKTFIVERAERLAASIGDQLTFARLAEHRGDALKRACARARKATRQVITRLKLFQARDPDRGPIRTYRYAHRLARLYRHGPEAAEARFWLVMEQRELRLHRGKKEYPFYALQYQQDLERYLQRFPSGPFALRARWELAPIYFDHWLFLRVDLRQTADYQAYLRLGGRPMTAALGARYRRLALRYFRETLSRLSEINATYRPLENPRWDEQRTRHHLRHLQQPHPPPWVYPLTLFPGG